MTKTDDFTGSLWKWPLTFQPCTILGVRQWRTERWDTVKHCSH